MNNWMKVEELFNKALELNVSEREAFLISKCGSDKHLYDEVISLLSEDETIHPLLDKKASELINVEEKLNFVGQKIGNYKLLEEIATGGMGTVFLAERCDGIFEQKVALKIIKPGLSTIPIIRRFQHERQILANLQHPNIARLFDGGVTEDKRPFFTMEYVDGIPIDEYCDKQKLSIKERLKLFMKVCATVQYAHNNLVVHRDLKPSNILITNDGNIKLLDFGIAKVLKAESADKELITITQAELNLLTPEYSSPEQIKNSNISVSTDVYSLGLVLYKLLTGNSAHEFKTRTYIEYENVVCNRNIIRPSLSMDKTTGDNKKSFSERGTNRKTTSHKLSKHLRGDLDNVCLMALRKEPERRYASAEMFAYDIERYLSNLPILAQKESVLYTGRKFVARHKKAVIAATILFFVVNSLILYYTTQLKFERDKAQREAEKSELVATFLQELFLISDPTETLGETITARELLERSVSKLKVDLSEELEVKSQLLNTIGKVYNNLGLFNSAEEVLLMINNNEGINEIDKPTYIKTLINLGKTYGNNGKYDLEEVILKKAKIEGEKHLGLNDPLLGNCYNNLGSYFYSTAKFDSSYHYYTKAEKNYIKNYGNESEKLAEIIYNLGVLEFDGGNLDKSDSLYRKSLTIYKKLNGELNAETATAQNELASVLRHKGDFIESEILYKKALATRIQIFGDQHPDVAHTLNHLSRLYYNQEQFEKAEPIVRKSLAIREKLYNKTHPEVSASKSSLGGVLIGLKKYQEAESLYREAYSASMEKFGESHPYTPAILGNIGIALMEQKKYDEAEKVMLESVRMLNNLSSYRPTFLSGRIVALADLYNRTNRFSEAESILREELASLRSKNIDDVWLIGLVESQLGYSLYYQKKNIEAEGLLVNGYNTLKKGKGATSSITKTALKKIIEFYNSKGRLDKVKEYQKL